jgi:hypothetical protein
VVDVTAPTARNPSDAASGTATGAPAADPARDDAPAATTPDRPRPRFGRLRVRRAELGGLAGLLVVLVAVSLVLVDNIREHPELSAIDEVGNGDYLYQASHGGIAQLGEELGPEITREMSCRGVTYFPETRGECPGDGDPRSVPGVDVTNSDIHPPTYYYVTAWLGKGILAVGSTDSLITAGRLVNVLWLGAGLVLLYLVLRDLRARVPARLAACLLVGLCPTVIQHLSMVNVTATAIPAGALVVLAAVRWEQRRWPLPLLALAAGLCIGLKADNLVPVLAVCLYLLARAAVAFRAQRAGEPLAPSVVTTPPGVAPDAADPVAHGPRRPRTYLLAAVVTGAAALAVEIAWLAVRNAIAIGGPWSNPGSVIFRRHDIRIDDLVSQLPALVLPTGPVPNSAPLLSLAGVALVAGFAGAMLHRPLTDPLQQWGLAVTAAAVLGGPLLVLGTYLGSSIIFPLPGRYGFGLLAPMAMLLGVALRNRIVAFGLIAAISALAVLGGVQPPTRTDGPPAASAAVPSPSPAHDRTVTPNEMTRHD